MEKEYLVTAWKNDKFQSFTVLAADMEKALEKANYRVEGTYSKIEIEEIDLKS
jgi:hypothetical protein